MEDLETPAPEGEDVEATESEEETEAETVETAEDAEAAPEADDETEDTETGGDDADPDPDAEEEAEPELVTFEFGGEHFDVPKGTPVDEAHEQIQERLKGAWRAHMERSESLAQDRKEVETQKAAFDKLTSMQGETLETYARGVQLQREIGELQALRQQETDPDEAGRIANAILHRTSELNGTIAALNQHEAALSQAQTDENSRQREVTRERVFKANPGFQKSEAEVVEYAVKNYGVPQAQAENWHTNPVAADAMYKAMLWDRSQAAAAKAAKPKPKAAEPVKAKAKAKVGKPKLDLNTDAEKMSAAEWARRRNLQLRNKAASR